MRRRDDRATFLAWYPSAWRERYGDELVAMVDDVRAEGPLPRGFGWSLVVGGLRERVRESGVVGDRGGAPARVRAGSLVVLSAWGLMMLCGASIAKAQEHFAQSMPAGQRTVAQVAIDVVSVAGVVGVLLVVAGALAALPSFVGFLRRGGWPQVRRRVTAASLLTLVLAACLVGLSGWAHGLTSQQRNGASAEYSAAFVAVALFVAVTLLAWQLVAIRCASVITFTPRLLRVESALAYALTMVMVVVTAGTVTWWAQVARHAPWFVQGSARGVMVSGVSWRLVLTASMMTLSSALAIAGTTRIARSTLGRARA